MSTVNEPGTVASGHQSNRSERVYQFVVGLPPLLLFCVLVYGKIRESYAAAANTAEFSEIQNDGYPVDNHSLTEWFDRRMSKDHSAQWRDVFVAKRGLGIRFGILATDWVVDFERLVAPDQPWGAEPIASRYAEEAKPILSAIEKLVADPKPVWQPLLIDGQMTMLAELQESRGIVDLLANEFRVAVHERDQQRAFRALELMRGVTDAFDWNIGVISDLIVFQHRSTYRTLIRGSLQFEFWTDPQLLSDLRQALSKRDSLDNRWRDSQATELAMTLAEFRSDGENGDFKRLFSDFNLFPFGVPATTRARLLEIMRGTESAKNPGTSRPTGMLENAIESDLGKKPNSSFTITGIPFATAENAISMIYPTREATAGAYVRDEQQRRWTLTAVAIKDFQLQQQRWPRSLSELTTVGLSASDWMATNSTAFGYQIRSESDQALLWAATPAGLPFDAEILPEPPSVYELDPERLEQWEVQISN